MTIEELLREAYEKRGIQLRPNPRSQRFETVEAHGLDDAIAIAEDIIDRHTHTADAAAAPAWQPIETAPTDGTHILACWAPPHPETCHDIDRTYWDGQWRNPDDPEHFYSPPTHWMPLPAPPGAQP